MPFCQSHTGCPLGNIIPRWNDLVFQVIRLTLRHTTSKKFENRAIVLGKFVEGSNMINLYVVVLEKLHFQNVFVHTETKSSVLVTV